MNMPLNIRALLKHAETSREAGAWEALARNLMTEKGLARPPARAKAKTPARKSLAAAIDPATLTLTECRAKGIKAPRERFAGGAYVWVLVEFKNGQRILTGQYPRAGKPDSRGAAIGNARARLLLAMSGGVRMDAAAKCPAVRGVRDITDPEEIERLREECFRQRAAFETFQHAPYWDGNTPRNVDWVNRANLAAPVPALAHALRAWGSRPAWHRATYTP